MDNFISSLRLKRVHESFFSSRYSFDERMNYNNKELQQGRAIKKFRDFLVVRSLGLKDLSQKKIEKHLEKQN